MSEESPIDPLREAIQAIETQANADWAERQSEYAMKKKIAEAHHDSWEQAVRAAVKDKKAEPPIPPAAITPNAPTRHRRWIVDSTTEQIARTLGKNPSGLICFRDELAGLEVLTDMAVLALTAHFGSRLTVADRTGLTE